MLNHSQTEKLILERQAAELFARCYETEFKEAVKFISHNVPQKPDVTCRIGNKLIDIEIAHLYGSQAEAQQILGKWLDEKTQGELSALDTETNTDDRLVRALNRILTNKGVKHYDSQFVWLVIRNANPQWERKNIIDNLTRITIPDQHPFKQIWLIGDFSGQTGLVPLIPIPLNI